jgi:hypothetical protein
MPVSPASGRPQNHAQKIVRVLSTRPAADEANAAAGLEPGRDVGTRARRPEPAPPGPRTPGGAAPARATRWRREAPGDARRFPPATPAPPAGNPRPAARVGLGWCGRAAQPDAHLPRPIRLGRRGGRDGGPGLLVGRITSPGRVQPSRRPAKGQVVWSATPN